MSMTAYETILWGAISTKLKRNPRKGMIWDVRNSGSHRWHRKAKGSFKENKDPLDFEPL